MSSADRLVPSQATYYNISFCTLMKKSDHILLINYTYIRLYL